MFSCPKLNSKIRSVEITDEKIEVRDADRAAAAVTA